MKVGVIGAGQLAAMMADAGKKIGVEVICLDPASSPCALRHTEVIQADYDDNAAQNRLLENADAVTYEQEELPLDALSRYEQAGMMKPSLTVLRIFQDRLLEKRYLRSQGLRTAPFESICDPADLEGIAEKIAFPGILKICTGGYDGKGQVPVSNPAELPAAWAILGNLPCVLEGRVTFQRELSIIAARNASGQVVCYPLTENRHRDGILRLSSVLLNDPMQQEAEVLIRRLADDMDYIGVITLELFDENGSLIANEVAPRVHNSGHWTIEGAEASQFENHLRAITNQPLIEPQRTQRAIMINSIGELPDGGDLSNPAENIFQHRYGKTPRPGRKLGHITLTEGAARQSELFESRAQKLLKRVGEPALRDSYFN